MLRRLLVSGIRRAGGHVWRDRIGLQVQVGPWWCLLGIGAHKPSRTWYGSWHFFRRVVWLRPIDYRRIESARP